MFDKLCFCWLRGFTVLAQYFIKCHNRDNFLFSSWVNLAPWEQPYVMSCSLMRKWWYPWARSLESHSPRRTLRVTVLKNSELSFNIVGLVYIHVYIYNSMCFKHSSRFAVLHNAHSFSFFVVFILGDRVEQLFSRNSWVGVVLLPTQALSNILWPNSTYHISTSPQLLFR